MLIVKASGAREPYTAEKLRDGIARACAKTSVRAEQIDELLEAVEAELQAGGKREVPSSLLGELVLNKLRNFNEVAYVRFASVYRQFQSIQDFIAELDLLHKHVSAEPVQVEGCVD